MEARCVMREWTREERYQRYEDVSTEALIDLKSTVNQSPYRQTFHIQPETGLLNDPNGLIYANGTYHVSHQWFPLGAVHGLKYWYHYTSEDLIHFTSQGPILKPDTQYDSHGVYSGSAFLFDGQIYYMYTGNHRDEDWQRHASQMLAKVETDGTIHKFPKPVIAAPPEGYTQHFRDPKVFHHDGALYAVIGAQTVQEEGCLLLYRSEDAIHWTFEGQVETDLAQFGYMWECPDYFRVDEHDIIMFCPQGIDAEGDHFKNIYQSGYLMGQFDIENQVMQHGDFTELDAGFDFYAPQTFEGKEGQRILIGWMGLPDTQYPTDEEGWAHCLTLPRELSVENGILKQRPIQALQHLRTNEETALGYANKYQRQLHPYEGKQYEMLIDVLDNEATAIYFELRTSKTATTVIEYHTRTQEIVLDRSESGPLPQPVDGTRRTTRLITPLTQLQIFVDTSSIEIFCNDGERVLTSRIFPPEGATGIKASTESGQAYLKFTKYELKG